MPCGSIFERTARRGRFCVVNDPEITIEAEEGWMVELAYNPNRDGDWCGRMWRSSGKLTGGHYYVRTMSELEGKKVKRFATRNELMDCARRMMAFFGPSRP